MFAVQFVINARAGDQFARDVWLPMLPSFQFDFVEWEGNRETVARVMFPEGAPIEIELRGEVLDASRADYLDHGWRVRPAASTTNVLGPESRKDGSPG